MTEQDKIDLLKVKIDTADAIVVGTVSGMSAAAGLRISIMTMMDNMCEGVVLPAPKIRDTGSFVWLTFTHP